MSSSSDVIGYLVPEFPSQTHAFFWREVTALRRLGSRVELLSTRRPPPDACRHAFADEASRSTHYVFPPRVGVALWALLKRPLGTLRGLAYVAGLSQTPWQRRLKLFGLLLSAADLVEHAKTRGIAHVHIHSCADAAHLGALASVLGGLRYSLTLHGDLDVYGTDHRHKVARASFVACVTQPLQMQLRQATGLTAERSPLLWMGVESQRFRRTGPRTAPAGELRALTVARLNPTKGHRFALAAVAKARERGVRVQYRIAGEGPERGEIEREIERLGLQSQVTLLGTTSEDTVLSLLQDSDVLLLTSVGQGEAAPVAVMEAMSCGLPVVCSIIGGTRDMIEHGHDGFLCAQEDVQAIAGHLVQLAGDASLRERIGVAARRKAESAFDVADLARRMRGLIDAG